MVKLSDIDEWTSGLRTQGIVESKIVSFEDLSKIFSGPLLGKKEHYIFRGHRSNSWLLEPTIDRFIDNENRQSELDRQLAYFRDSLVGRRGENPRSLDEIQYWALGQHFGLYTPLLDWTYSPYVALFFGFAEKGADGDQTESRVLFSLNKKRIIDKCAEIQEDDQKIEFYESKLDENQRMLNQSGLFTISRSSLDIESWIRDKFPENQKLFILLKIHIHNDLRWSILKQLNWMNINYLTLFPDLIGSAKHSNLQLEIEGY